MSEAYFFYASGKIVAKLGEYFTIALAFMAIEIRLLCYITLRNWYTTWMILPVEFLTGLGFALTWSASLIYCNKVSPSKDKLLITVRF